MWNWATNGTPAPISSHDRNGGTAPTRKDGAASRKPTKKTSAPGRTYDTFTTWVEKLSVQGSVRSAPHTTHFGTTGTRRQRYHAKRASAPNDSRFSSTNGASGTGHAERGQRISSPCIAPG